MANELELSRQEAESLHDDLLDAVDLASDQDTITWLTDNGRRIAAIVPVDVAETHEAWMANVLATAQSGPTGAERAKVRAVLVELGFGDLAHEVGNSAPVLAAWLALVAALRAAKAARS